VDIDTSTAPPPVERPRPRRGGARAVLILFLLAVIAVGVGAFQAGQQRRDRAAAPTPTSTGGTGAFAATGTSAPPTTAPLKARVLKFITKNVGTEANPNRVYLVPGQPGVHHPRIVVRPGERIQIRVDNQDDREHTWTFPGGRLTVQAYEEDPLRPPLTSISTSKPFLAPTKPGIYRFYCRYRKLGMDGALVVRG
jgi:hypothetical protein